MRGTETVTRVKNYQFSQRHRTYIIAVSTFVSRKTPEYPNAEHVSWIKTETEKISQRGLPAFRHMIRATGWLPSQTKKEEEFFQDREFPQEVVDWFQSLESKTTRAKNLVGRISNDFEYTNR